MMKTQFSTSEKSICIHTHVEAQNNKIIEISGRVESLAMGDGDSDDENDDDDDECIKRIDIFERFIKRVRTYWRISGSSINTASEANSKTGTTEDGFPIRSWLLCSGHFVKLSVLK